MKNEPVTTSGKKVRCRKMRLTATYIRIIGRDEKDRLWDIVAEVRPVLAKPRRKVK